VRKLTSTGFHTIRWSSIRAKRYQSRLQALPSTRMVGGTFWLPITRAGTRPVPTNAQAETHQFPSRGVTVRALNGHGSNAAILHTGYQGSREGCLRYQFSVPL